MKDLDPHILGPRAAEFAHLSGEIEQAEAAIARAKARQSELVDDAAPEVTDRELLHLAAASGVARAELGRRVCAILPTLDYSIANADGVSQFRLVFADIEDADLDISIHTNDTTAEQVVAALTEACERFVHAPEPHVWVVVDYFDNTWGPVNVTLRFNDVTGPIRLCAFGGNTWVDETASLPEIAQRLIDFSKGDAK